MKSDTVLGAKFKTTFFVGLVFAGITISATIARAQATSSPGLAHSVIRTHAGGGPLPLLQVYDKLTITQIGIGSPNSVASDGAGGFYFTSSRRVYRVAAAGTLTLIAGNGMSGFSGDGGPATSAQLDDSSSIAADRDGNLFIGGNNRVRKVTPAGIITTVAGNGTRGFSGDDGPATSAQLYYPGSIAVDGGGNLFIPDSYNHRVRKVTPAGIITTVAGNGTRGFSGDDGPATSAQLYYPGSIAVDGGGNLFIADSYNHRVRKVTSAGIITSVAGNGTNGFGGDDGPAASAQLMYPYGVAVDAGGNLFIVEQTDNRVRKVTPAGIITTVAGKGPAGFSGDGGSAASAQLSDFIHIAADGAGNLFIADVNNNRIRKVTSSGVITTVAGNGGFAGEPGPATSTQLLQTSGVAVDRDGNLFIADSGRLSKVSTAGIISSISPLLFYPIRVAVDAVGNVSTIAISGDGDGGGFVYRINTERSISAIADIGYLFDYDGFAPAGEVCLAGIAIDTEGNLYVSKTLNQSVWKITPAGDMIRVAGLGNQTSGFSGDGGPAKSARLSFPNGLAVDKDGNLFIADSYNNRIRKVTPAGIITTVAGNGTAGFNGDGGPATSAQLWYPLAVTVDRDGNLFIADSHNHRIRKVTPAGIITTVAGNGTSGFSGDGGFSTSAQLDYPTDIAIDNEGNLFVADYRNNRIRKVSFGLIVLHVTPISAGRSNVVSVTLDGENFDSSLTINPIDGITVTNLSVVSPTSATATFTISAAAIPGRRAITISTSAGTSNAFDFMVNPPPELTSIVPSVGVPGAAVVVALTGKGFASGLTLDAGNGITISDVSVTSATSAAATFTIASGAALGVRNVTLTTSDGASNPAAFNIVLPFPDLAITSTHPANFGVGFTETYNIRVSNVGLAATTNAITIVDVLPSGLTFVSGGGTTWTCSVSGQAVTCSSSGSQGAGASTTLDLDVAVSSAAAPGATHLVSVATAGDVNPSNDFASEMTPVVAPAPNFVITPSPVGAGQQAALELALSTAFPHDVTGSVLLNFSSNAAVPLDDPAIQFASGGRQATFLIPANTLEARFDGNASAGPIGFQTGTVAGTLGFSGVLQAGTFQTTFSPTAGVASRLTISRQAPSIQKLETSTQNGFGVSIALYSTTREVAQLSLTFTTTPVVSLSCGTVPGCSVSNSTMSFDVRSLFGVWFGSDTTFGSLSTLHLPFSISGTVHGTVAVTLSNTMGTSKPASFPLP